MNTFTIIWGHSGTHGHEWTTAREASQYAGEVWGEVEADTPEAAAQAAATETGEGLIDWWHDDATDRVHVILGEVAWATLVRGVRYRLDLSQQALADALGVHLRTLQAWEGGEAQPQPYLWRALRDLEREVTTRP